MCQCKAQVASDLPILALSWLFHTLGSLSQYPTTNSSVGHAVWSLVISRASHTDLPGGQGIILFTLIMEPHILLHEGVLSFFPLFKYLNSALHDPHPVVLHLQPQWSICFGWYCLHTLQLTCCLPYLLI